MPLVLPPKPVEDWTVPLRYWGYTVIYCAVIAVTAYLAVRK
jgi:hypothetical protein